MKTIFIRVVIFNAVTKKIEVQCVSPAQNVFGVVFITNMVVIEESTLPSNWNKWDIFNLVAQTLSIDAENLGWATDLPEGQLTELVKQSPGVPLRFN